MILNDLEKLKIETFCADKDMYNAVKKVILAGIYSHGVIEAGEEHDPLVNGAFSLASLSVENPIPDEALGQHIRGMWNGINALQNAFNRLDSVHSEKPEPVVKHVNIAE